MTTTTEPSVPVPVGAYEVHPWKTEDGVTSRRFFGVDHEGVYVLGIQKADGSIDGPFVNLGYQVGEMTAAEARQIATHLIAAADELDGWAER